MQTPSALALLLVLLAAAPPARAGGEADAAWELVASEGAVRLYQHRDRPSRLRAVSVIEAPLENVGEVLRDAGGFPRWLDACREASIVEASDELHQTLHLLMGYPFGIRRDLVVRAETAYDLALARGNVQLAGVQGSPVPIAPGVRRMRSFDGAFVLEYLGRERTGVAHTIEADPDVGVPAFVVRRITRTTLRNTMRRLGEAARSPRYVEAGRRSRDRALFEELLADAARVRAVLRNRMAEHYRDAEMIERLIADPAVTELLVRGDGRLAEALFLSGETRETREQVARAVLAVHARTALGAGPAAERLAADDELLRAILDGRAPGRPSAAERWDALATP